MCPGQPDLSVQNHPDRSGFHRSTAGCEMHSFLFTPKGMRAFESIWQHALVKTGACQVALAHWDDGKGEVGEATTLAAQGSLRIDRTWQRAKVLAKATNRQQTLLTAGQRVNIAELHDTSCR